MNALNQVILPGSILIVPRKVRRTVEPAARFQCIHGFGLFPNTKGRDIWGQWLDTGDFAVIQADGITSVERMEVA